MSQIVVLVLLAQTGGGAGPTGITSLEVGRFLSMRACQDAVDRTVALHPQPEIKVSYLCVPLTGAAKPTPGR